MEELFRLIRLLCENDPERISPEFALQYERAKQEYHALLWRQENNDVAIHMLRREEARLKDQLQRIEEALCPKNSSR